MGRDSLIREDQTCGCGLYIHPKQRTTGWHIPDCEYYSEEENQRSKVEHEQQQSK